MSATSRSGVARFLFSTLIIFLASSYAHAAVSVLSSSRSIRFGEYDEVTAFGISQGFGTIDQTTTQSFPGTGTFLGDLGGAFLASSGGVSQHSTLTSSSFQATGFTFPGFFYLAGSSYIKYNIAAQTCSATFALTTPMSFTMNYSLPPGNPPGEGSSWVALHPALSNGPTTYNGNQTGTLAPGNWTLTIDNEFQTSNPFTGGPPAMSRYYDVNFALSPVPEPSGLACVTAALAISNLRRTRSR